MVNWRNSVTQLGNTTKYPYCKEMENVQLGVGEMRNYKTFWVRNLLGKYNLRVVGIQKEYYSDSYRRLELRNIRRSEKIP